jgi:curli biogenesis system outer membrane secretion channel CsgG
MPKQLLVILTICMTALLSACAGNPKDAYKQSQPNTLPVHNITRFNDALQCFDNLLIKSRVKPFYITSEGIPNHAGGEISLLSGRDMLINTISRLDKSNVFRFINLPSQSNNNLLEQLGIHKSNPLVFEEYIKVYTRWNKGKPYPKPINYPDYSIIGAITQSDKNISSGGFTSSLTFQDADFGISKDDMTSVISLDMNIMDTANFEILNGISSANSIAVYREGIAGDLGGRIKKAGVYLNFSFDSSEGMHQAIRTLIQLNTIEILGKLAKVPYEQCLNNSTELTKEVLFQDIDTVKLAPTVQADRTEVSIKMIPAKESFKLNDILTFNVEVSADAYVNCFYQNYLGRIWQVFPNYAQPSGYLIANQSVSIPKKNEIFEIVLDQADVIEQIMCLSSYEKLHSNFKLEITVSLPKALSVTSLAQVLDGYQQKTAGKVSQKIISINVK